MWSVLQSTVRRRFHLPPSLKQLEDVLHEGWLQYSTRDYSVPIWVYSKKDTWCITGKWRPNSVLIKKFVSFTGVSIILSIPFIFKDYSYSPSPWEEVRVLWQKRWLHNLASKMQVREMATDQGKLVQTGYKHEQSEMFCEWCAHTAYPRHA
jgi:hypothetical protein